MACVWVAEKLCDPLVTHGPYLSALEARHDEALYKSTFTLLYFCTMQQLPVVSQNDWGSLGILILEGPSPRALSH